MNSRERILTALAGEEPDKIPCALSFYRVDLDSLLPRGVDPGSLVDIRFLRFPILGKLITQLAIPSNLYIAHQDRRVVMTHRNQVSSMELGEKLIQADLPIIEYRRKRAELQRAAAQQESTS